MKTPKVETIVFGAGCFWSVEAIFKSLRGVKTVEPGYADGEKEHPMYEDVSSGKTGHAEVVKVVFDPEIISFKNLLEVFFAMHDPTAKNRQGADVGSQYRSMILYTTTEQENQAINYIKELGERQEYPSPIVTEVKKLEKFYPAESYHKDYYTLHQNTAYCQVVISPKLSKLRQKFSKFSKD